MEKVNLELFTGRLGKDPELRYTRKQEPICFLSIAVNREGVEMPEWKRVVVFSRQAELCSVHLKKGNTVFVQGQRVNRAFMNKEGQRQETEEVQAKVVGFTNL